MQVDAGKLAQGYYEGTITISNGKGKLSVPTILFVKEPDYPRVSNLFVEQMSADKFEIGGYFPGGAEEVKLFIYQSYKGGTPLAYVGDIAVLKKVPAGYDAFYKWDGKVNGAKLVPGYYNVYAYATKIGHSDLAGVNFQLRKVLGGDESRLL